MLVQLPETSPIPTKQMPEALPAPQSKPSLLLVTRDTPVEAVPHVPPVEPSLLCQYVQLIPVHQQVMSPIPTKQETEALPEPQAKPLLSPVTQDFRELVQQYVKRAVYLAVSQRVSNACRGNTTMHQFNQRVKMIAVLDPT